MVYSSMIRRQRKAVVKLRVILMIHLTCHF